MAVIRTTHAFDDKIAYLGIALTSLFLSWYTWGHWGNLRIDIGRELYVPSSILQGKLLYRDLWYPYGPLAPYLQALLYGLFGQYWNVLYILGLSVTMGCTVLLYAISRHFVSPMAAFLVSFSFLMQGFQPRLFNYVLPYGYAASLGVFLGLTCLYFAVRTILNEPGPNLLLAGSAAGLALLCKQEFGLAGYLLLVFVLASRMSLIRSFRCSVHDLLTCLPGILINVFTYGWFIWRLSPQLVFMENMQFLPKSYFMKNIGGYWLTLHGLRFIPSEMAKTAAIGIISLAAWFFSALIVQYALRYRATLFCTTAGFLLIIIGYLLNYPPVSYLAERLPLAIFPKGMFWLGCLLLAWEMALFLTNKHEHNHLALAAVALYALTTGLRVMVQVEPYGYSIFYNSTLFLAFVILLCRVMDKALPLEMVKRTTVLSGLLALEAMGLAIMLFPNPQLLPAPLTTSWGTIYTNSAEAELYPQIISFIKHQKAKGNNVMLIPEEATLYALSGIEAPTRWYMLIPGVVSPSQELDYIAQAERYGIDYILLSNRNTSVYNLPYFGLDYNKTIYRWFEANYEVVGEFGRFERNPGSPFAMLIYKRRDKNSVKR